MPNGSDPIQLYPSQYMPGIYYGPFMNLMGYLPGLLEQAGDVTFLKSTPRANSPYSVDLTLKLWRPMVVTTDPATPLYCWQLPSPRCTLKGAFPYSQMRVEYLRHLIILEGVLWRFHRLPQHGDTEVYLRILMAWYTRDSSRKITNQFICNHIRTFAANLGRGSIRYDNA